MSSCGWPRRLLALCLGGLAAALPATAQEPAAPPLFGELIEVRTGFVRLTLPAGAPPPRAEELEVVWKRRPQRVLRVVGGADDPLELGLAVDRSASFHHAFAPIRAAALALVERTLSEADRLFAVAFTDEARLLAEGRGEAARVLSALPTDPERGTHPTALFEALGRTLGHFENADARAALIATTDGCDTAAGLDNAASVAKRARDLAIPVFLLMPDRDACQYTQCRADASGRWQCTPDGTAEIQPGSSSQFNNPAARKMEFMAKSEATGATAERDYFAGLIAHDGGGAFVVSDPAEWQDALTKIFERLSRQWTVVFEPSSKDVESAEVKIYSNAGGRRRRVR
jgi:hypothetical protein